METKQKISLLEQDLCQAISNEDEESVELYRKEIAELELPEKLKAMETLE